MKKVILLLLMFSACSGEKNATIVFPKTLDETDSGKAYYNEEIFNGFSAYKEEGLMFSSYKTLSRGDICQLLVEYKDGKPIGLIQYYNKPTKEILIEDEKFEIGTKAQYKADLEKLYMYSETGKLTGESEISWDNVFIKFNGKVLLYNEDESIKTESYFSDGKFIRCVKGCE
jgi:antitoxin component YwqK of YwqJK toxin-antitoxin module